jgi:hypothetical protein
LIAVTGSLAGFGCCAAELTAKVKSKTAQKKRQEITRASIRNEKRIEQQPAHHKQARAILQLQAAALPG